ncbi:hypothetical protein [Roseobacter litoralis]|uniref:hypothetical protein n=1 Tax=Roseobacter litoralis TaxID=42443 RepID=UPI000160F222|nr:hypothetical protein [Roseobacter litoralis]
MENLSFQTPTFAGVGVLRGQIGFARARDVEARIDEGVEHACTVSDEADADLIQNPRMQFVAPLSAGWGLDGVADLLGALQLHRIGPAVALVHHIAQAVEGFLTARRRDFQAAARGQL